LGGDRNSTWVYLFQKLKKGQKRSAPRKNGTTRRIWGGKEPEEGEKASRRAERITSSLREKLVSTIRGLAPRIRKRRRGKVVKGSYGRENEHRKKRVRSTTIKLDESNSLKQRSRRAGSSRTGKTSRRGGEGRIKSCGEYLKTLSHDKPKDVTKHDQEGEITGGHQNQQKRRRKTTQEKDLNQENQGGMAT